MKPYIILLLIACVALFIIAAFNTKVAVRFEWLAFACLAAAYLLVRIG
jgi:hypothetical protein